MTFEEFWLALAEDDELCKALLKMATKQSKETKGESAEVNVSCVRGEE